MTSIDDIKAKVDIVDLVSESVELKQSGRNFNANCPFHAERTPSFYVFPDQQHWRCFGACAAGGDVFSFVMRKEGVGFGEAMRALAQRAGIAIDPPAASREKSGKAEQLKRLHKEAVMFFHQVLMSSPEGETARAYLKKRGLATQTLEDYRLGYSPPDVRGLERYLLNQGFKDEEVAAAGLVRKREDGSGSYGFFRGRLMIPIQDSHGDYLGFGARALDSSNPKYLNSSQSVIFDKGSVLYGLHRAVDVIRKAGVAVIVEGYMDVLMAHQHGYHNVVAPMGTALTEKQVGSLKRLASVFVLALDPDAAGDTATLRSLESSWHIMDRLPAVPQHARLTGQDPTSDLTLKVMDLPRGKDPDDVIRERPDAWPELVARATPVVEYVFRAVASRTDLTDSRAKVRAIQRVLPFVQNAPTVIEQNQRISKLAELLHEEENRVKLAIDELRLAGQRRGPGKGNASRNDTPLPSRPTDALERYCVAMLLRYPELLPQAANLSKEHFNSASLQEIFEALASGKKPEDLKGHLDEHLDADLSALLEHALAPATYMEREQGLAQCIKRLEERRIKLRLEALQARLTESAEADVDLAPQAEELRAQLQRLYGSP